MSEADQVARDAANRALVLIEAHERVCSERQAHIIESLAAIRQEGRDMRGDIKGLYSRVWAGALSIITMLAGACGGLIYLILMKAA